MYRRPAPLAIWHVVDEFDCGTPELNSYLIERAAFNHVEGYARTYAITDSDHRVAGFYSICSSAIGRESATRGIGGHGAPSVIPVLLLARLAVDRASQGRGLGGSLLRHAFETAVLSAETIGSRAIVVHAIDSDAERFYLHHGFRPAKGADRTLLRSLKDIASSLATVKLGR